MIRILAVLLIAVLTLSIATFMRSVDQITTREIPACEVSVDETDESLFDWLINMNELFEAHADSIWTSSYRVDQMPLFLIRVGDQFQATHAYIVNHRFPEQMDHPCQLNLPNHTKLGPIYRLEPPPAEILEEYPSLGFEVDFAGENTYLLRYGVGGILGSPTSWGWVLFVAHEGLHRDQFMRWNLVESDYDRDTYTVDPDNFAHILLEHKLLLETYMTEDPAIRDRAMLEFAAVRSYRINIWEQTQHDLLQEQTEGTARYVEYRIIDLTDFKEAHLQDSEIFLPIWASDGILGGAQGLSSFGRFYISGSALGLIMDEMGLSWKSRVERGESPSEVLIDHFESELSDLAEVLERARTRHNFVQLSDWAERAVNFDPNSVERDENYPYPYAKPSEIEVGDLEPRFSVPDGNEYLGEFMLDIAEVRESEVPYYSPDKTQIRVLLVADNFGRETRVHISKTEFASTKEWYEAIVESGDRLPRLQLTHANGIDAAFSVGILGSFITIRDGQFIHISGLADFKTKLKIAGSITRD